MYNLFEILNLSQDAIKFIPVTAFSFILTASYRMIKKVVVNNWRLVLLVFSVLLSTIINSSFKFPILLLFGIITNIWYEKTPIQLNMKSTKINYKFLYLFIIIGISSLFLSFATENRILELFERFYKYGYLVIGDGQVVVPMMQDELVILQKFLSSEEFLTGYGIVQGFIGPMFSFAAYAGGMAMRNFSPILHILGAIVSGIAIFIHGTLLIWFVYPIWQNIRDEK